MPSQHSTLQFSKADGHTATEILQLQPPDPLPRFHAQLTLKLCEATKRWPETITASEERRQQ